MPEQEEEKKINLKKGAVLLKPLIIPLIILLAVVIVGIGSVYVINKDTFEDAAKASKTYTGNAKLDPEKGIIIEIEDENGNISEADIEEILEQIDGAGNYLKDDEDSTREEKLEYLLNAELVTQFPYISSLEGDESKLNGVVKFYRYSNQIEAEEGEEKVWEEAEGEASEDEDEDESEEENKFDPKKVFYIGDSWTEGLHSYIKGNVNEEYSGKTHFYSKGGAFSSDSMFSDTNLMNAISKAEGEVSTIVVALGLNGPSSAASGMESIINCLSTNYPDKAIYILKVPHVGKKYSYSSEYGTTTAEEMNTNIDNLNKKISEYCSDKTNVKFIDTTNNMMTEDLYLSEQYSKTDGLHLNEDMGYPLWYKNIKECIREGKTIVDSQKFQMIYVTEEEFEEMLTSAKQTNDTEIFKYFTINEDDEIVIATWSKTTKTVTTNDPEITTESLTAGSYTFTESGEGVYSASDYTIVRTNLIKYDTLVENYSMPFNLLWAFLVETKDYNFTAEIAKLAYESDICVGIYENQTISVRTNTEEYNKSIRYTENTELNFPSGVNLTNDVVQYCYGSITENGAEHSSNLGSTTSNTTANPEIYGQYKRDDGGLYYGYITGITSDGIVTDAIFKGGDAPEGAKFKTTTNTTTVSATNPSIGVFYVDNWMATWRASYKLVAEETKQNSSSGTNDNDAYKSLPVEKISSTLLEGNGIIGKRLFVHSNNLKQEAINTILGNGLFEDTTEITATVVLNHIEGCVYCQSIISDIYGKSLEDMGKAEKLAIPMQIINDANYTGEDTASKSRRTIYEHVYASESVSPEEQLNTGITYKQWPTAERANVNIQFKTSYTKTPYSYEQDTVTVENEGEKFKEIVNDEEYYESKQAILNRTEWFWEYIRAAENTAKLEDLIRIIFNIAFDTDKFGEFSEEDIQNIFKIFEPQLRKISSSSGWALLKEYIRRWENGAVLSYINGESEYTEYVAKYINEEKTEYYLRDDGYGNPAIGFGVDIFNGGYADELIAEGYTEEQLRDISGAVSIPVDIIDGFEDQALNNAYNYIKNETADLELENYQLYALVSRAYNCGTGGALTGYASSGLNFVESYLKYYNPETDNKYGETEGDLEHKLYTEFMNTPIRTNTGEESAGLKRRRESEWTLFQTGYFDTLQKSCPGGGILETCVVVMNQLLDNNVRYSLTNLAWNDIEKSIDFSSGIGCCCATYVAAVLYESGTLTEEFINQYNYNYAGSATDPYGIYQIMKEAGWIELDEDEAEPGDICCYSEMVDGEREGHAFIYAGDNLIWDQNSGCISEDGTRQPSRGATQNWRNYIDNRDVTVWRMP